MSDSEKILSMAIKVGYQNNQADAENSLAKCLVPNVES